MERRGRSKVSPQEGEKASAPRLKVKTGVYTAKGVETIEESSIASKQVTVGVSTAKAGETTEASSI